MPEGKLDEARILLTWTELYRVGSFESAPPQTFGTVPNPDGFESLIRYIDEPGKSYDTGPIRLDDPTLGLRETELAPVLSKIVRLEKEIGTSMEAVNGRWVFKILKVPDKHNLDAHPDSMSVPKTDSGITPESVIRYTIATKAGTIFYRAIMSFHDILPRIEKVISRKRPNQFLSKL